MEIDIKNWAHGQMGRWNHKKKEENNTTHLHIHKVRLKTNQIIDYASLS